MPRRGRTFIAGAVVAAVVAGLTGAASAEPPADPGADFGLSHRPVCPPAPEGVARCHAEVVTSAGGRPLAATSYASGYSPAQLKAAYSLTGAGSATQTIAIVDAYDNPN